MCKILSKKYKISIFLSNSEYLKLAKVLYFTTNWNPKLNLKLSVVTQICLNIFIGEI